MPRRPIDTELRREVTTKLRLAIEGKVPKKEASDILRVSRQMLDRYLKGRATPAPDVVLRAMKAWNFTLRYRGRELGTSYFTRPDGIATEPTPVQLELALADIIAALNQRDVQVSILKKAADSIQLQVLIKFAG
jgi:transcriptional regulator with XRE-family HTH domain